MELEQHQYYHLYNRSNGQELVFQTSDNYIFFLKKFRKRFKNHLNISAYCLMPTHFHFLIQIDTKDISKLKQDIGIHLSSYTKAFNNAFKRNGSLFQQHTKARHLDDMTCLITLLTYIHQNPLRAGLVESLKDWPFSSYRDLAGLRNGTLVDRRLVDTRISSREQFIDFSQRMITKVKAKYWI